MAARPVDISPYLFCNRHGECYFKESTGQASGFDSIWQRFMKELLNKTELKERFMERDIRAKVATDADDAEHARDLLSHSDTKITRRVYIRKPVKVIPLNSKTSKE